MSLAVASSLRVLAWRRRRAARIVSSARGPMRSSCPFQAHAPVGCGASSSPAVLRAPTAAAMNAPPDGERADALAEDVPCRGEPARGRRPCCSVVRCHFRHAGVRTAPSTASARGRPMPGAARCSLAAADDSAHRAAVPAHHDGGGRAGRVAAAPSPAPRERRPARSGGGPARGSACRRRRRARATRRRSPASAPGAGVQATRAVNSIATWAPGGESSSTTSASLGAGASSARRRRRGRCRAGCPARARRRRAGASSPGPRRAGARGAAGCAPFRPPWPGRAGSRSWPSRRAETPRRYPRESFAGGARAAARPHGRR